jgi:peptidyl-prolyl cis-trans isomerase B (cyclophilin B)
LVSLSKVTLTTNFGDITLELNADKAPITVANFLQYVESGFYDGVIFHRVIDGFMAQGGGFDVDMKQKKTKDEIKNEADNGLGNDKYTVAMARTSIPDSASSQFFINIADNDFLNHTAKTASGWGYCVFGKVVEGMDVVDKIAKVKTTSKAGHRDVPAESVIIEKASVI